jgi:hypothetical protein
MLTYYFLSQSHTWISNSKIAIKIWMWFTWKRIILLKSSTDVSSSNIHSNSLHDISLLNAEYMKIISAAIIVFSQNTYILKQGSCGTTLFGRSPLTIPPSARIEQWLRSKHSRLLTAGFLLDLLLGPEDGGDTFVQVNGLLPNYIPIQPRRSHSVFTAVRISTPDIPSLMFSYTIFQWTKGDTSLK